MDAHQLATEVNMLNKHNIKVSYMIGVKLAEHLQQVTRDICSKQHQQAAKAEYLNPE